jgi:hypothetical protein
LTNNLSEREVEEENENQQLKNLFWWDVYCCLLKELDKVDKQKDELWIWGKDLLFLNSKKKKIEDYRE